MTYNYVADKDQVERDMFNAIKYNQSQKLTYDNLLDQLKITKLYAQDADSG